MASQYNVHEAKTHLSKLVERARNGEEIIIAKAGAPAAKLTAIEPVARNRRTAGAAKGLVEPSPDAAFFEPMSDEELRDWGML